MKIIYKKEEAVEKILDQQVVAIFQGHSEWGARALGNRSMLFDSRNKDAQKIVNRIKGRQWWRPTAATILYEHRHDYLNMQNLDESPYMTFAIDAKQKAIDEVPACVHVDNTCRFQTLKREQNPKYYDLIKLFYDKTNVPILLNTSFNLKGRPIVESFQDAILTLQNSEINYLYTP
jgi:carbamoyltransferase|tara:strand:+ start:1116 stop:1643 length:528 start_codon:yes stop_codon:yes gene_type:complete